MNGLRPSSSRTRARMVRLGWCAVLGVALGLGGRALGLGGAFEASSIQATPLSALSIGTQLHGQVRFAGTAEAPALVFFAEDGRTFGHVCKRESWTSGCTTLQLQSAFAHSAEAVEVQDVQLRVQPAFHRDAHPSEVSITLERASSTGPFLVLGIAA